MKETVRLSQCMIVKNEEKNIRQALSWGKGIVSEQIVVDTGSTDQTVKIAEEMGARIYHIEWQDDFSAAKNYAIEQASGEWIAFLDADEYFNRQDAAKLLTILEEIDNKKRGTPDIIRCAMLQLNDAGKIFATSYHDRIFRNNNKISYRNPVHEALAHQEGKQLQILHKEQELAIFHTGYSRSVYDSSEKLERNIRILEKQLKENPEDYNAWCYLGDSLMSAKRMEEAEAAYRKVLNTPGALMQLDEARRNTAFYGLMKMICLDHRKDGEKQLKELYREFSSAKGSCPDLECQIGQWMVQNGRYEEGIQWLLKALEELETYKGRTPLFITGQIEDIYVVLMNASYALGRMGEAVKYAVLVLRMNRYHEEALERLLMLLSSDTGEKEHAAGAYGLLSKLYHFQSEYDRLFVVKASKITGFLALEKRIIQLE